MHTSPPHPCSRPSFSPLSCLIVQVDRELVLYGFVRGSHLKPTMKMHLIGAGDFDMTSVRHFQHRPFQNTKDSHHFPPLKSRPCVALAPQVDALPDPCPLPEKERSSLKGKETLLYAPMANVGAVKFDKDAMYIDLRQLNYTKVRCKRESTVHSR